MRPNTAINKCFKTFKKKHTTNKMKQNTLAEVILKTSCYESIAIIEARNNEDLKVSGSGNEEKRLNMRNVKGVEV